LFGRPLHLGNFVDAPLVPPAGKLCAREFLDDGNGLVLADNPSAQRDARFD
jgi:hypothetical protein